MVWDLDLLILDEVLSQHSARWAPFLLERSNDACMPPHGPRLPYLCPSSPAVGARTPRPAASTLPRGWGARGPSQPQMAGDGAPQSVHVRGAVSGEWPRASGYTRQSAWSNREPAVAGMR